MQEIPAEGEYEGRDIVPCSAKDCPRPLEGTNKAARKVTEQLHAVVDAMDGDTQPEGAPSPFWSFYEDTYGDTAQANPVRPPKKTQNDSVPTNQQFGVNHGFLFGARWILSHPQYLSWLSSAATPARDSRKGDRKSCSPSTDHATSRGTCSCATV